MEYKKQLNKWLNYLLGACGTSFILWVIIGSISMLLSSDYETFPKWSSNWLNITFLITVATLIIKGWGYRVIVTEDFWSAQRWWDSLEFREKETFISLYLPRKNIFGITLLDILYIFKQVKKRYE